jgi:S-adenosylmethionine-diacylgycerolhomoserine-N-methlytransferase
VNTPPPESGPHAALEHYYRLHSQIYDATRWSFLFGRAAILREVAAVASPVRILEVGCGTGKNLVHLCRLFPGARVTGMDLSETMLQIAARKTAPWGGRVELLHEAYGPSFAARDAPDLILFSYALTMFNPGFDEAIATAHRDLAPGGHLAVVDFHDTRFPLFARWMGVNHVRMDGQLRPLLASRVLARIDRLHPAYGGVWRYLMFVGQKPAEAEKTA